MSRHIEPRPAAPEPEGNVGPSNPNRQVLRPPRKVAAPGRPARDPNRGGSLGAVDMGAPQDFSSRQPFGTFTPRPS